MKRFKTKKSPSDWKKPEYKGASLTIPGLAPDLQAIIAAATEGQPLPIVGRPNFDEDEASGLARLSAEQMSPAELLQYEKTAAEQSEAAPDANAGAVGKPDKDADERSEDKDAEGPATAPGEAAGKG